MTTQTKPNRSIRSGVEHALYCPECGQIGGGCPHEDRTVLTPRRIAEQAQRGYLHMLVQKARKTA